MARRRSDIAADISKYERKKLFAVFLRYAFFLYSLLSFVFWFLNCLEIDWLYKFNGLFLIPYLIVKAFYVPQGVSVDFTLAIIGGISLVIGFIMDILANKFQQKLYDLQDEEENLLEMKKIQKKQNAMPVVKEHPGYTSINAKVQNTENIQSNHLNINHQAVEIFQLVYIISPQITKMKRRRDDLELTFKEVDMWKQRINKKLIHSFAYSKPTQKGYYRKNLFFIYDDFNFVDKFVYFLKPTLASIIAEFKKYGILVSFDSVLSVASDTSSFEKEVESMDVILALKFADNSIMVTEKFKKLYDKKTTKQYMLNLKGEYNLSKNLNVVNRQNIYVLTEKQVGDDIL